MNTLIPAPKSIDLRPGCFCIAESSSVGIAAHSPTAERVSDWLAARIGRAGDMAATIHLGLLDDLAACGLAEAAWKSSPAFATRGGREQGYVLDVTEDVVTVGALTAHGLQNGAATLLQLLRPKGDALQAGCCRIEDWPDVRFRAAADWLLNAEISRWGYERGDGRDATMARMKRKVDQAAAYKINVVWFDGFGWNPDRTPGYAEFVRELSDYARARHIRLVFGGYGGAYGAAYQASSIYFGRYWGQVFENRKSYPDGEVYDCVGHPSYPTSWHYGTCLSNDALAELKIAEMVEFVRRCRPGLMYIHDIDTGGMKLSLESWKRRCPTCRERWPSDEMASPQGAAGAYASWFKKVAAAINAVRSEDGEYVAARDCVIAFVNPTYTSCEEPDDVWAAQCDHYAILSECLGPAPNVQFVVREQFVSDTPKGLRVQTLKHVLDAVGNGHGLRVSVWLGGDKFYNDQLVPTNAAFYRHWRGADTVYTPGMGSVAEPVQLINAYYAWNGDAPGAYEIAPSRSVALDLVRRCRSGLQTRDEIYGPDGLLRRACDRLYGADAGRHMAELFSLGVGEGEFPLATGWKWAADDAAKLSEESKLEPSDRVQYWHKREAKTAAALQLIAAALNEPLPNDDVRGDLEWLRTCLEIGQRLCRALTVAWTCKLDGSDANRDRLAAAVDDIERFLDANVPSDITDPAGGDLVIWRMIVDKLRAIAEQRI